MQQFAFKFSLNLDSPRREGVLGQLQQRYTNFGPNIKWVSKIKSVTKLKTNSLNVISFFKCKNNIKSFSLPSNN